VSDATKREFPAERFDAVYSRETILHIKDKKALFQKILVSLAKKAFGICSIVCKLVLIITPPYFCFTFTITNNLKVFLSSTPEMAEAWRSVADNRLLL